jgi:pyruvate/2-oxoglutarate dehydrogenase complex dihydrolipoamide acyltransferase (E2) component
LASSTFPEGELALQQQLVLQELKSRDDDIFDVTGRLLRRTLFATHPYRFDPMGSAATVARFSRADCQAFAARWLVPRNMVVSVFSDLDEAAVMKMASPRFGRLKDVPVDWPALINSDHLDRVRESTQVMEKEQSVLMVGFRGQTRDIIRRDVEVAASAAAAAPAAAAAAVTGPEYEDMALTPIRATIARRLPLSKGPVPHFYVTSEVAMDRAWELREELNGLEGQPKISVNDLVIRACALALLRHPGVNASFQGESIRVFHRAHIGVAVALPDGLITPVLRDCQAKSLAQIAVESRDLAERARNRKLRQNELSGATFSISNLGMFDVAEFSAIINPPEGAILAVGSVRRVPVVEAAGLGVGRRMALTLSCDHRVMDGAMGARFLQDVKRLLEEPLRLLV